MDNIKIEDLKDVIEKVNEYFTKKLKGIRGRDGSEIRIFIFSEHNSCAIILYEVYATSSGIEINVQNSGNWKKYNLANLNELRKDYISQIASWLLLNWSIVESVINKEVLKKIEENKTILNIMRHFDPCKD